jgi:hypothetical protein
MSGANPGGRLRHGQLYPGLHRARGVPGPPLPGEDPADRRRRHQEPGGGHDRAPHAAGRQRATYVKRACAIVYGCGCRLNRVAGPQELHVGSRCAAPLDIRAAESACPPGQMVSPRGTTGIR